MEDERNDTVFVVYGRQYMFCCWYWNSDMEDDMELKNLDHTFDIPVGDAGVTIRQGLKWSKAVGKEFDLVEEHSDGRESKVVGKGRAIGAWTGPFDDIPDNLISIEHNMMAQDWLTLLEMLEDAYDGFNRYDTVTALIYVRTQ